jgi:hypothetical protein
MQSEKEKGKEIPQVEVLLRQVWVESARTQFKQHSLRGQQV